MNKRKQNSETRKAISTAILGQSLGAPLPQSLINGGLLSLFILTLGGSKFAVGAAFTMNFFAQIARTLVAPYVDVANRKTMVVFWFTANVLCFAGFFFAYPIQLKWGSDIAVWYVVAVFLVQRLTVNIAAAAWMPYLSDMLPESLRGRFFGRMRRNFQLVSFTVIVVIGYYLGTSPPVEKFYFLFAVLFIMALARPLLLLRLPELPPQRSGRREHLFRNLARPLRDTEFRKFLIFWAFVALTVNMARPFAVPFLKEDLDFPSSITTYASAALILGMAIALLPWGRVADRCGNKLVFLLNIVLIAISFNLLAITPHYQQSQFIAMATGLAAFLLTGIAIGGLGIAHTVRQMYAAPAEHRGSYMGLFFTMNGIVSGVITTVSGAFLDKLPETITLLGTSFIPIRLFFPCVSVCILLTTLLLIRLEELSEPSIRYNVANFISLLPPSLTVPLRMVRLKPRDEKEKP